MKKFNLSQQESALVIIAHPDDETIWLSGLIMLNPKINWTVLCLSRSADQDRAPKFRRVAEHLNFKYFHENLDDLESLPYAEHVKLAQRLIKKNIGNQEFDFVVTHGANGEYGHRDHKSIHEAVSDLLAKGMLRIGCGLFLHYKKPIKLRPILVPRVQADLTLKLPARIYQEKINIMSGIYGFAPDGIDASYCTRVEAFKIKQYNQRKEFK